MAFSGNFIWATTFREHVALILYVKSYSNLGVTVTSDFVVRSVECISKYRIHVEQWWMCGKECISDHHRFRKENGLVGKLFKFHSQSTEGVDHNVLNFILFILQYLL